MDLHNLKIYFRLYNQTILNSTFKKSMDILNLYNISWRCMKKPKKVIAYKLIWYYSKF